MNRQLRNDPAAALERVLLLRDDVPERVDWRELFGNDRPVEFEIGSGKGLFLQQRGQSCPDRNFAGVEWSLKHARLAADRVAAAGLINVRVISADVRVVIARIPEASVAAAHMYFPDPWWKRRHHKRRLGAEEFFLQVARILEPAGPFTLATDVKDYFDAMLQALGRLPQFGRGADPKLGPSEDEADFHTHFERKYVRSGRSIYACRFERTSAPPWSNPLGIMVEV